MESQYLAEMCSFARNLCSLLLLQPSLLLSRFRKAFLLFSAPCVLLLFLPVRLLLNQPFCLACLVLARIQDLLLAPMCA